MLYQPLFAYPLLIVFLLPIIISGIIFLRKTSSLERFELLFPVGSILGIALFIFILNMITFFIKGLNGAIFSYLILIIFLFISLKNGLTKMVFPSGKQLLLYMVSLMLWGGLLIWKGNYALIGSDTNLYYAVSHTFIKGNFPPMTPWQPDLPLSYHLGAYELLGAFYAFTNLSFQFLHIFFSTLFIFLSSQIIIWMWQKKHTIYSFFWSNLAASVVLISFGFFKIVIPVFPLKIENISSLHQLFLWIRSMPSVNQSIEVYGAPINLDALIYFIFHSFGLAIFLSLLMLVIHSGKKVLLGWIIFLMCITILSLTNESIFIVVSPVLIVLKLFLHFKQNNQASWKIVSILLLITFLTISLQQGMLINNLFPKKGLNQSVLLFPSKEQVKQDFKSYHHFQQISKKLEQKSEWLPFSWNHLGVDILIVLSVISFIFINFSDKQKLICWGLFLSGILSLIAYNYLVPRFLVANGNRFLAFSFIFLSLVVSYSFFTLIKSLTNKKTQLIKMILIILAVWIFLPTLLPPLALLSKNRFAENKLLPKKEQISEGIRWMKDNLPFDSRVMVLDARAPHPSGVARALTQGGVFSPIFPSDFRAYTIEASPQYLDIAYYLSPKALDKLKINIINMDSFFYDTLITSKKDQLADEKYFELLFSKIYADKSWDKVFRIKSAYLKMEEIPGTLGELVEKYKFEGSIYIDNEENFHPSYLRRAIIFSLRDKKIYYHPQSGVYLNVEVNINQNNPDGGIKYDYLLLGKNNNPERICRCEAKLIWKGMKDEVHLWSTIN